MFNYLNIVSLTVSVWILNKDIFGSIMTQKFKVSKGEIRSRDRAQWLRTLIAQVWGSKFKSLAPT